MTNAEKTEIRMLVENIRTFKKTAEVANAEYFDKKVSRYAIDSIDEAEEVEKVVKDTIEACCADIINFGKIEICIDINHWNNRELFYHKGCFDIPLSDLMTVRFRLKSEGNYHIDRSKCNYIILSTTADNVEVESVIVYTSNTELKYADWEYADIHIYDILWHGRDIEKRMRDGNNYDILAPHNSATWKAIYEEATWRRTLSALKVHELKKMLQEKSKSFKTMAKRAETIKEDNAKIEGYKKVL